MIKDQVEKDFKAAMIARDSRLTDAMRGIKSVILNAEIASGKREEGLDDATIVSLLQKEYKKRSDAIELYQNAGEQQRMEQEQYEQSIIQKYVPEAMSEESIVSLIDEVIEALPETPTKQDMGRIIGAVKAKAGGAADGGVIARLVQGRLT